MLRKEGESSALPGDGGHEKYERHFRILTPWPPIRMATRRMAARRLVRGVKWNACSERFKAVSLLYDLVR